MARWTGRAKLESRTTMARRRGDADPVVVDGERELRGAQRRRGAESGLARAHERSTRLPAYDGADHRCDEGPDQNGLRDSSEEPNVVTIPGGRQFGRRRHNQRLECRFPNRGSSRHERGPEIADRVVGRSALN